MGKEDHSTGVKIKFMLPSLTQMSSYGSLQFVAVRVNMCKIFLENQTFLLTFPHTAQASLVMEYQASREVYRKTRTPNLKC